MTQSGWCQWCLVKEMKTLYTSVKYAAGMCAQPRQCVEQLMITPAGLCVSSCCLGGGLLASVLGADWPSCCLVGLWWAAESLMQLLRFLSGELAKRSSIIVPPTFPYISSMYITPYEVMLSSMQGVNLHLTDYLLIQLSLRQHHVQTDIEE